MADNRGKYQRTPLQIARTKATMARNAVERMEQKCVEAELYWQEMREEVARLERQEKLDKAIEAIREKHRGQ